MDSSVLQLFSVEEVLDRLGRKVATGCLHVFNSFDSSNVFFKNGEIVNAIQGASEGPVAIRQILDWKDARFYWQPDAAVPMPIAAPIQLPVQDFLTKQKPNETAPAKPRVTLDNSTSASGVIDSLGPVLMIPAGGATTGPIHPVTTPVRLTLTRTISQRAEERVAQEQRLLEKYKLLLVSVENPELKLSITRVSSLIGRNPACDLTIPHASISRQHCLLQITDRGVHIKDLDTTNGTMVNGIALKEGYINPGDKVAIGHLHFVLEKAG
ncbi:MAG: FHA domain-containing protein [Methylacidiphilales bacterium]|nr:FHA domain-containing protein [Candidatus Methylacidiphilales bacterium]